MRREGGRKAVEKGYTFYGCETWPACTFATWDKPTDDRCPDCGKSLFQKKGSVLACLNESCGYEKKLERKSKKASGEEK